MTDKKFDLIRENEELRARLEAAEEALGAVRELIAATYGADKLPPEPRRFRSKKGAQDAHEAIRPTYFDLPPEVAAPYLEADELKLYRLIWDRFVASQMQPAVFDVTRADIERGRCRLRATGRVLASPGFLAVYQEVVDKLEADEEEGNGLLPPLAQGDRLRLVAVEKEQKFTQPPAAYSEATLVKALEENGIGRPSTYAAILATITEREYVQKAEGRLRPTPLGKIVNGLLQQGFNDILNEGYTAELEQELDRIEDGELAWKQAIADFDRKFDRDLATAQKKMTSVAAKSYKPNQDKNGLEETTVTQLRYPLSDRSSRYPMPAGGLFSTAEDTARFCQMVLNEGVWNGKRLLSKDALHQLTSRQTAPELKESYGLGFAVGSDWCGHGGAYATNMEIDRQHGLIFVWMVQHSGFPGNGSRSQAAFKKAALAAFGQ